MITSSVINNPDQQILEVFNFSSSGVQREDSKSTKQVMRKLSEVICGQRSFVELYSKVLQKPVWIINEGLVNPSEKAFEGVVITMHRLVEILSGGENTEGFMG